MSEYTGLGELREQRHDPYQKKLESALAELGMRYWEYDIAAKRLYRSALIRNEVGYSAYKENVPESYVEEGIIHPAYARAYLDFYHNLAKGIEGRLVFQSKFADGHWGWLDITYTIHSDADGKPIRAVGIGGDISRYSSITIFLLRQGTLSVLYANDVFYQMTGYTREEYNQNPGACLNAELDAATMARTKAVIQRGIQTGELQELEYPLRRPDGKVLWLYRRFSVVPQLKEGVYLVPAITVDRTERHAAEKKLADERNMYQSLLDESSALMTVVDAESFEVLYANRSALDATKHLKNGYVGQVCYRCIQNADVPCPSCLLVRGESPDCETKELAYGERAYRMTYKKIVWNGRKALLECSEDVTDQKRSMMILEERQQQQARIIDNIPTGIIVFRIENGTYTLLQVNPAICRMMQMDPTKAEGLSGDAILMLTHPDDRKLVMEASKKTAVPGTAVHYEFRSLNRETGLYTWTSADGKSVRQPDGTTLVYIGYQDITGRREKEDEYKRRIAILTEMDEDNLIAKGQHNLTQNRVLIYSAKASCAADVKAGRSYDDAVLSLVERVLPEDKRSEISQKTDRRFLLAQFAAGEKDGSIEFRRVAPNHTALWTVLKYSLLEEPDTHDIIALMYSYDITDRVRESRIIAKIGSMEYDLMGLVDAHTHQYTIITQFGSGASTALARTGDFDAAVARRLVGYVDDAQCEELLARFKVDYALEQLKEKDVYSLMYSLLGAGGKLLRKRFQFSFLDELKETLMFFRSDITEMYEKEQEQLRKIEGALETAKTASSAKTNFFSRMSHDMRTPMNGILGLAELSRDETDPAALKRSMEKIYESGRYLLGLINDTLDFQRIESGKMTLEPQIVSTTEVVGNIVDMIRQTAEAKGVRLTVKNGNADLNWYVRIDPMRMKQIFVNLLSNAVKFTPPGGTVELGFQLLSREGMISHDLITVRDTGIGMSEDFLKNGIFKPFSQENNTVTAQYAGSGLGLSIAKSLVELMGGHMEAESELGVGTTFSVYIDFERVPREEVSSAAQSSTDRSNAARQLLAGQKILLVEDHPLNAEIAMRLLQKAGCEVDWLQNGADAVQCFTQQPDKRYGLVLMDIRMPVMDGLEAARQIRALNSEYAKTVPIIAMTANAYEEDIQHSLEAGMNAHLSKPIDTSVLYDLLARYLRRA